MKKEELLNRVKQTVKKIDQSAEIYLYGSRARKDFHKDSDWDFLIIINKNVTSSLKDEIRHNLYRIEWESDKVISSIIIDKKEWNSSLTKETPFYKNVAREGIQI